MKKFILSLLILLVFPLVVLAEDPKVLTLESEADGSTLTFNGTVEAGSHAVMCKLYDGENDRWPAQLEFPRMGHAEQQYHSDTQFRC